MFQTSARIAENINQLGAQLRSETNNSNPSCVSRALWLWLEKRGTENSGRRDVFNLEGKVLNFLFAFYRYLESKTYV